MVDPRECRLNHESVLGVVDRVTATLAVKPGITAGDVRTFAKVLDRAHGQGSAGDGRLGPVSPWHVPANGTGRSRAPHAEVRAVTKLRAEGYRVEYGACRLTSLLRCES